MRIQSIGNLLYSFFFFEYRLSDKSRVYFYCMKTREVFAKFKINCIICNILAVGVLECFSQHGRKPCVAPIDTHFSTFAHMDLFGHLV